MDCVKFLDELCKDRELIHNIGCFICDSPFNCMRDESGGNIRQDDVFDTASCEAVCVRMKALLHNEGQCLILIC